MQEAEALAIRQVIEDQITAFQRDDAEGAFRFASPEIQGQFGSALHFLRMVKTSYYPVYRPRSVMFENSSIVRGQPAYTVLLLAENGQLVRATYIMQQQSDRSWRVLGCYLEAMSE
jgi:ketosteroid isomerase-like protein